MLVGATLLVLAVHLGLRTPRIPDYRFRQVAHATVAVTAVLGSILAVNPFLQLAIHLTEPFSARVTMAAALITTVPIAFVLLLSVDEYINEHRHATT